MNIRYAQAVGQKSTVLGPLSGWIKIAEFFFFSYHQDLSLIKLCT